MPDHVHVRAHDQGHGLGRDHVRALAVGLEPDLAHGRVQGQGPGRVQVRVLVPDRALGPGPGQALEQVPDREPARAPDTPSPRVASRIALPTTARRRAPLRRGRG